MNDLGSSKSPQLISSDLICCEQDGVSHCVWLIFHTMSGICVWGAVCNYFVLMLVFFMDFTVV